MSIQTMKKNGLRVSNTLMWFKDVIEDELWRPKNLRKRQWPRCENRYLEWLLKRLADKAGETPQGTPERITAYAKVASVAMMLADKARKESQ